MKKKIITSMTALILIMAMVLPVSANTQRGETNLTADVSSTYTLSIPMSQKIEFEKLTTEIGAIKIAGNIRPNEEVTVLVTKPEFWSTDDEKDSIEYTLTNDGNPFTNARWSEEQVRESVEYELEVNITKEAWDNAHAGDYESAIIFNAALAKK